MFAVVDVYGAVTAVSLCGPVTDSSQSATATISHSVTNVMTPTDATSVNVSQEAVETNDVTAAVTAAVCLITLFVVYECIITSL